jgi:hypothetical protein
MNQPINISNFSVLSAFNIDPAPVLPYNFHPLRSSKKRIFLELIKRCAQI